MVFTFLLDPYYSFMAQVDLFMTFTTEFQLGLK